MIIIFITKSILLKRKKRMLCTFLQNSWNFQGLPGENECCSKSLVGRFAPAINHHHPYNLSALTWPPPIARPWTAAAWPLPYSNARAAHTVDRVNRESGWPDQIAAATRPQLIALGIKLRAGDLFDPISWRLSRFANGAQAQGARHWPQSAITPNHIAEIAIFSIAALSSRSVRPAMMARPKDGTA